MKGWQTDGCIDRGVLEKNMGWMVQFNNVPYKAKIHDNFLCPRPKKKKNQQKQSTILSLLKTVQFHHIF